MQVEITRRDDCQGCSLGRMHIARYRYFSGKKENTIDLHCMYSLVIVDMCYAQKGRESNIRAPQSVTRRSHLSP